MGCHFKCSKNAKMRKNLEASYIALWKPDLNEQKDFKDQCYLEMGSPHRVINVIMQTPQKEVYCSWQLMFYKKQKNWVRHVHLVNDSGSCDRKTFCKVKIVFIQSPGWLANVSVIIVRAYSGHLLCVFQYYVYYFKNVRNTRGGQ